MLVQDISGQLLKLMKKNCFHSVKLVRAAKTPLGELLTPSQRLTTVHIDIVGPFEQLTTLSNYYAHTRWLEAIPVAEITADIFCKTFIFH